MKIIGAGLPRTGTMSTKAALEQLGFGPCYHMVELMSHLDHGELWQAAADGGPAEWRELFADYGAVVDAPGCFHWRKMAEAFPAAKILLTTRDTDRWFGSVVHLLTGMVKMMEESPDVASFLGDLPFMQDMALSGPFALRPEEDFARDRGDIIKAYHAHVEQVRAEVPPERLLVFDVRQGWEPLCEFLEVDVPGEPFPHLNEGDTVFANTRAALDQNH